MKKFKHHLRENKLLIVVTVLFILGLYHLLMCLIKLNTFNIASDKINLIKPILYRFYHVSYNLLIGLGFVYAWSKYIRWIWLYVGFKIAYNIVMFIPAIQQAMNKSLVDGLGFGLLILVIILLIRNAKDY